MDQKYVGT